MPCFLDCLQIQTSAATRSHITMEKKEKIFKVFGILNSFWVFHSEIQLDFTLNLEAPKSYTKAFVYPNVMVSHVCFLRWARRGNKFQLAYYLISDISGSKQKIKCLCDYFGLLFSFTPIWIKKVWFLQWFLNH